MPKSVSLHNYNTGKIPPVPQNQISLSIGHRKLVVSENISIETHGLKYT